ncbi:unnamed protein product [Paramecium sonneborni]|nr:unnamed protein product [Paramecium sonneborni]
MLFIVNLTIKRSGQLSPQVYISILTAIFTALSSFYKFLSIRPTNLLQEDFDTLALKQNANYNLQTKQCLQEEQSQISNYISLFKNPNHELIQIEQSEEERQTLLN